MPRYKDHSYEQTKLIPVSYDRQIVPGTFEHTLSAVIDSMDMAIFESRYGSQVPPPEAAACFMRLEAAKNKKPRQWRKEPMCSTAGGSGF